MESKEFNSILEDEKKRLLTIIFENAMAIKYIRIKNKEWIDIDYEKESEEFNRLKSNINALQNVKGKKKKEEIKDLQEQLGIVQEKVQNYEALKQQEKNFKQRITEAKWQIDNIDTDLSDIIKE